MALRTRLDKLMLFEEVKGIIYYLMVELMVHVDEPLTKVVEKTRKGASANVSEKRVVIG